MSLEKLRTSGRKIFLKINSSRSAKGGIESGQTLIENMLAMAILGIVLTPMFGLQTLVTRSVVERVDHLRRLLEAEQFLATTSRAQPEDAKQATVQEKGFTYELRPIADTSALKGLSDIYREQVTTTWRQENRPQKERAIYFVYKPEKIKE